MQRNNTQRIQKPMLIKQRMSNFLPENRQKFNYQDTDCKLVSTALEYIIDAFNKGVWKVISKNVKFDIDGVTTTLDPLYLSGISGMIGDGTNYDCHNSWYEPTFQYCEYYAANYTLGIVHGISTAVFDPATGSGTYDPDTGLLTLRIHVNNVNIGAEGFKAGAGFDTGDVTPFTYCTDNWQGHYWKALTTIQEDIPTIPQIPISCDIRITVPLTIDGLFARNIQLSRARIYFENIQLPTIDFNYYYIESIIEEVASVFGYNLHLNDTINDELNKAVNYASTQIPSDFISGLIQDVDINLPICGGNQVYNYVATGMNNRAQLTK